MALVLLQGILHWGYNSNFKGQQVHWVHFGSNFMYTHANAWLHFCPIFFSFLILFTTHTSQIQACIIFVSLTFWYFVIFTQFLFPTWHLSIFCACDFILPRDYRMCSVEVALYRSFVWCLTLTRTISEIDFNYTVHFLMVNLP